MAGTPVTWIDGLVFPEGPRWRDGRLYFSDMNGRCVCAADPSGAVERLLEVPGRPSGLGWLPDGRMLVVSMEDQRVLVVDRGEIRLHADLAPHVRFHANDMLVDARGGAWVSNFGFDVLGGEAWRTTTLVRVEPDGAARVVARDLMFPNGMVLADGGRTLIVAEQPACRLVAFAVGADGSLSERRVWAELPGLPDGLAIDAEGAVWAALPIGGSFEAQRPSSAVRVAEGGRILDVVPRADDFDIYACALGGADGRTLFLMEGKSPAPDVRTPGNGRIRTVQVDVGA